MRRETPLLCTPLYAFWMTNPHPHQWRKYLIDDRFLKQKAYKDIRISYSLKYKRLKKKSLG